MKEEKNAWKWAEFKVSIVPIEEEEEEGKVVIKKETRQIKRRCSVSIAISVTICGHAEKELFRAHLSMLRKL